MESDPQKLAQRHHDLTHSEGMTVTSHVQRAQGGWYLNTLMIDGYDVPFKYKRQKRYKSLQGQRVNLTYYPTTETVAGMAFEIMKVVRVRIY